AERDMDAFVQAGPQQDGVRDQEQPPDAQPGGDIAELARGVGSEEQLSGGVEGPGFAHGTFQQARRRWAVDGPLPVVSKRGAKGYDASANRPRECVNALAVQRPRIPPPPTFRVFVVSRFSRALFRPLSSLPNCRHDRPKRRMI